MLGQYLSGALYEAQPCPLPLRSGQSAKSSPGPAARGPHAPRTLAEFVGQRQFLGEGKLLNRLLKADRLGSVIFYGPPGTGKTTLARLLAAESRSAFIQLNAVTSGVKGLRETLDGARDRLSADSKKTLLFVDEIHRFNRSQQDVLLPDVEEGIVDAGRRHDAEPVLRHQSRW